jgi:alanine racemase
MCPSALLQYSSMIRLEDLLAVGGRLHGAAIAHSFSDFCYDSRLAAPGHIFLAVKTDRRDGHVFILDAVRGGCTGVLCERPPAHVEGATVIVVPDVCLALQQWAGAILKRYHPLVVAVTGSVGKTTTKCVIATLLAGLGPTFHSRRSFNSLYGLPIALGRLEPHHRFAVLEMGVDRFGEMQRLATLFPPQLAIVTNVAPTHLRYLRDEEYIAAEKTELVRALPPDGWAILNGDDVRVAAMAGQTAAHVLRYGVENREQRAWGLDPCTGLINQAPTNLDLVATNVEVMLDGTRFDVLWKGQAVPAFVPLLGRHSVYTALAALGVALRCGMSLQAAIERLRLVERQAGRLNPLPGHNGSILLDDTFNASPASMHAALDTLAALSAKRRIAILGDMLELGETAASLHREVGRHATTVADLLVTKGDLAAQMGLAGATQRPERIVTYTAADAIAAVRERLQPGDLVLVKGSAEMRMEAVIAGLLAPQLDPAQVLVRQERAFAPLRIAAPDRPTWLEVDLQAIADNTRRLKALVGPNVQIMATLKADAYGHGAIRTAYTVLKNGASSIAVATLGEAHALRDAGLGASVLILGYTPPWQVRDALRRDIRLTVFDPDVAREVSLAAQDLRCEAVVHVEVDTGMARLGLQPSEVIPFLHFLRDLPDISIEGLFTHFATADSANESFAREQLRRFREVLQAVERAGLRPRWVHAANSAALLRFPEAHFDLVRPGLALYGLSPSTETSLPPGIRPALSFKTEVAQVKTMPPGSPISYGGTWVTPRPSRIATIPVGYADGFRRAPRWRYVLVHGQAAPVVGCVTMDYAMLDVTDIPDVHPRDEVVLIGKQREAYLSAEMVAEWLGTINYDVVATILPRVPRIV